jgi:hypothetical protein
MEFPSSKMMNKTEIRLLTSLCENHDQPLLVVAARHLRSSRITALLSRGHRERSMDTLFNQPLRRAAQREQPAREARS